MTIIDAEMEQQMADRRPGLGETVLENLQALAKFGVTDTRLADCHTLTQLILDQMQVNETVSTACRVALLRDVLVKVANEARRRAREEIKVGNPWLNPNCLTAAAAELLQLSSEDSESIFMEVADIVCGKDGWELVRRNGDNGRPSNRLYTRASIWVYRVSYKTAKRSEDALLRGFEGKIKTYLNDAPVRDELLELIQKFAKDTAEGQPIASWLENRPASFNSAKQHPGPSIIDPEFQRVVHDFASQTQNKLEKDERENNVELPDELSPKWDVLESVELVDQRENVRYFFGIADDADLLEFPSNVEEITEFLRISKAGRLVILGRGGAGKTTLATKLALRLLDRAHRVDGEPVPFIFNVSSWNPNEECLEEWMVHQLETTYRPPKEGGKGRQPRFAQLVEGNYILPIIDGFDEMGKPLRAAAIRVISGWLKRSRKLVLLSRPEEYRDAVLASRALRGAAVLMLQDLELSEVKGYLSRTTNREGDWEAVFSRIGEKPEAAQSRALQTVLATPLMAMLAGVIYSGDYDPNKRRDPSELLDAKRFDTPDAMTSYLLDAFVKARFENPPARKGKRWRYEDARKWLGFLAIATVVQKSKDFAWWKTDGWLGYVSVRFKFPLSLLGFAALVGLVVSLIAFDSRHEVLFGWSVGILSIFVMLFVSVFVGSHAEPRKFAWRLRTHAPFLPEFSIGEIYVTFTGVLFSLAGAGVLSRGHGALVFLIALPLLAAPLFSSAAVPTDMNSPAVLLRDDRRAGLLRWALYCGAFEATGLVLLLTGRADSLSYLVWWPITVAMFVLLPSASSTWLLRQASLALNGRLPWRCLSFLNDAHSRGILRQSGGVYKFRHALLQNRLAEWYLDEYFPWVHDKSEPANAQGNEVTSDNASARRRVGQFGSVDPDYAQIMLVASQLRAGNYDAQKLRDLLKVYRDRKAAGRSATIAFLLVEVLRARGKIREAIDEIRILRAEEADVRVHRQFESHQILIELLVATGELDEATDEYVELCQQLTRANRLSAHPFDAEAARKTLAEINNNPTFQELDEILKGGSASRT